MKKRKQRLGPISKIIKDARPDWSDERVAREMEKLLEQMQKDFYDHWKAEKKENEKGLENLVRQRKPN